MVSKRATGGGKGTNQHSIKPKEGRGLEESAALAAASAKVPLRPPAVDRASADRAAEDRDDLFSPAERALRDFIVSAPRPRTSAEADAIERARLEACRIRADRYAL